MHYEDTALFATIKASNRLVVACLVLISQQNALNVPYASPCRRYTSPDSPDPVMPIYEFECSTCAHRFERLQKLSDADPTNCPECGKSGVRRRLTAPAFRLSGSGWYETDFKKEGDVKRNLTSSESTQKSDAPVTPAESPAVAKPETSKTESKPTPAADS